MDQLDLLEIKVCAKFEYILVIMGAFAYNIPNTLCHVITHTPRAHRASVTSEKFCSQFPTGYHHSGGVPNAISEWETRKHHIHERYRTRH